MRILKSHRVFFSCASCCRISSWSDEENLFHFGPSGSRQGAGFNLELWASIEGPVDEETGWLLSEKDFDRLLWSQASQLDHRAIHQVIPEFQQENPTLENLAKFLLQGLEMDLKRSQLQRIRVVRLRLIAGEGTWIDILPDEEPRFYLSKTYRLPAVHRHHNPQLSMEENRRLYDKCSALHGHEYVMEISVRGLIDERTGLVKSRGEMDREVKKMILDPFAHTLLNDKMGNTSGEILTEKWSEILRQSWGQAFAFLIVRETRKNSFVEASERMSSALLMI